MSLQVHRDCTQYDPQMRKISPWAGSKDAFVLYKVPTSQEPNLKVLQDNCMICKLQSVASSAGRRGSSLPLGRIKCAC